MRLPPIQFYYSYYSSKIDQTKSNEARNRYDRRSVIVHLEDRYTYSSEIISRLNLTYSDALHIILAVFQSQPLSLKYLAMKKVLELNLEVKDLPQILQVKPEKVG